jgi:hypothetical protein
LFLRLARFVGLSSDLMPTTLRGRVEFIPNRRPHVDARVPRLAHEHVEIVELEAAWGRAAVIRALERATRFRRFKAADVRAILVAGSGVPTPIRPGLQLQLDLPEVPTRPLSAYAVATLQ